MEEVYLEKSREVYSDGGNLLIKEVSEASITLTSSHPEMSTV